MLLLNSVSDRNCHSLKISYGDGSSLNMHCFFLKPHLFYALCYPVLTVSVGIIQVCLHSFSFVIVTVRGLVGLHVKSY